MGAVSVPKADIHRHRHSVLQRFPEHIVNPHHKLRRPGKSISCGIPKLYSQKPAFRRHARIAAVVFSCPSAVSCRDSRHRRSVSGRISCRHKLRPLRRSLGFQRLVKPLFRILHTDAVSFRRALPLPWAKRLIPERTYPRGSVIISEIRQRIVDARINHRYQHALSIQRKTVALHRINAGHPSSLCCLKI